MCVCGRGQGGGGVGEVLFYIIIMKSRNFYNCSKTLAFNKFKHLLHNSCIKFIKAYYQIIHLIDWT